MELAEPFFTLKESAMNELTRTSESMKSRSETMRELMVMEDADPFWMLRESAVNELILTSESTKTKSDTIRELIVMEDAEPFSVAKKEAVNWSTVIAGTLRVLTVRVLMDPNSAEKELTARSSMLPLS